jgi:hypothetical protein
MDPAAFRTGLGRIGFSVAASNCIVSAAGQAIAFEDLVDLAEDDITTLCSALRRPGGTIAGPAPGNVEIRNPGIPVSALAERRLKIVVYLARLFEGRINRTLTPAMISIVEVRNAQVLMERNAAHRDPTEMHKIDDAKDMMVFLKDPDSFLSNYAGENKFLSHVYIATTSLLQMRQMIPELTTPQLRTKGLLERAPHAFAAFAVDNAALATILKDMVSGFKEATTWARDLFRDRDGQAVMQDWMLHFCGTSRQETLEVTAKAIMNNTFCKGEKPRFTFVTCTGIHRGCHKDINSVRRLAQPAQPELDELLKVRKYPHGIDAPKMSAAVAVVKASPATCMNFDITANYLIGFIKQNTPSVRVATATTHGGGGRGGRGGRGRGRDEGRGRGRGYGQAGIPA